MKKTHSVEKTAAKPDGFLKWEKIAAEAGTSAELVLPQADGLNEKQQESLAKNYMLVCLLKGGTTTRDAIARADLAITKSAALKLLQRYEKYGLGGLVDHRLGNKKKKKLLSDDMKKRVLAWWFARSAAGPRAIWKQLVEEYKDKPDKVPGYDVIKKYIKSLPEAYKLFRQGKLGIHEWERSLCPVVRFNLTTYSNQRWQVDNSPLDIWVRVLEGDKWVPVQAQISATMCAHSRAIPGFLLSAKEPDSWTTALLLMRSVAEKENPDWKNRGLPAVFQPDRGGVFLAHAVTSSLAYMGVAFDPDPPYYPNRKGKIERWFLTLDRGCLRILPGHMDAIGKTREAAEKHVHLLLTIPQLRGEIERWIVYDYHQQTHSETGRKPAELWEETVRLRMPDSEEALHLMLLKSEERTVYNTGIRFKFGGAAADDYSTYWAPELIYHIRERVSLRYNPEDRVSVLVYAAATNEYLCEAWRMGEEDSKYDISDVKQARSEFQRGIRERIKGYVEEIQREDRKRASQDGWDTARGLNEEMEKAEAEQAPSDEPKDEQLLEDFIELFNRQDEGGDSGEVRHD